MSTAASTPCGQSSASSSAKRRAAQLVHLLVVAARARSARLDVALGDDLGDPARPCPRRPSAIRAMVGRTSSGTATFGHPQPGDLGDVHGQVAHPLELADHPQRGDDDPQVAGDRLLQGEQRERRVLDPLAGPVDLGVGADHLLGDLGVAGRAAPAVARRTASSTLPADRRRGRRRSSRAGRGRRRAWRATVGGRR